MDTDAYNYLCDEQMDKDAYNYLCNEQMELDAALNELYLKLFKFVDLWLNNQITEDTVNVFLRSHSLNWEQFEDACFYYIDNK